MKLKNLSIEELESMSYSDIAELIITEKGSSMKIVDIFKKICSLLKMSDAEFENKIADFFELISTDKKFIVLEKGFCDLRKKHTPTVIIEDDEEEIEPDIIEEEPEDNLEEEEEDIFYDTSSDEDDVEDKDDDLNDFIVVDDEETGM